MVSYSETEQDSLKEIKDLELGLAKNAKDLNLRVALGVAYSKAKRSEAAMNTFREVMESDPKNLPAHKGLLAELLKQKDTYEARILLHDMIKKFGPKSEFYNDLCRLYSNEGFLEKAVETCGEGTVKDPQFSDNYIYLAQSARDKLEPEKASDVLDKAVKLFPNNESVLIAAGENQLLSKNYSAAYKSYRQAVIANRSSLKAIIGYAQSSLELQKNQESLGAFIQACTIDKKSAKDLRYAIAKLRDRKDKAWQMKFEAGLERCP
jgi:tetratricopeptide (TPR) repeat protein